MYFHKSKDSISAFYRGRVRCMRQAFPPAGVIFFLSGLEIKMVQVLHSWKVFSHGCKYCPRDQQGGRDSGNQTLKAMDLSVRAGFPVVLPANLPFMGKDGGRGDVVFREEA